MLPVGVLYTTQNWGWGSGTVGVYTIQTFWNSMPSLETWMSMAKNHHFLSFAGLYSSIKWGPGTPRDYFNIITLLWNCNEWSVDVSVVWNSQELCPQRACWDNFRSYAVKQEREYQLRVWWKIWGDIGCLWFSLDSGCVSGKMELSKRVFCRAGDGLSINNSVTWFELSMVHIFELTPPPTRFTPHI